jgi:uncharacterized protein YvpB
LRRDLSSSVIRRRRAVAVVLAALLAAGVAAAVAGGPSNGRPTAREPLRVTADGATVATIDPRLLGPASPADRVAKALRRQVASVMRTRRGQATITYRTDTAATARQALRAPAGTTSITLVRRPIASAIAVPVVRQRLRNNCESAALAALLAAEGVRVSQLRLQAMLPRSGPLDPIGQGADRVWGDPDRGFVGRPDGGGVAGGFGVYPTPVRAVARELGVRLVDLSGASAGRVYRRVLRGRPVIAWIGLSAGPYGSWRTPSGRVVRVNFGEHTVVLRGVNRDGSVRVMNPLQGTAETWSPAEFEAQWELLDRRAVGV